MKKSFMILFTVLLLLCSCHTPERISAEPPLPKYEIANLETRTYMWNTHCVYQLLISSESTDEELLSVARFLLNDGYYQHKFLFYRTMEEVPSLYTVALIKEEDDGTLTLNREGGLVPVRDEFYPDTPSSSRP